MAQDEFSKLFKYVQEMRVEMNVRFEEAARDREDIRGAIAELSAQVRDYHREVLMISRQLDRLRDAIKQIAQETGVKLSVEL